MNRIDNAWWQHLAPKELLSLRGEVQALLWAHMKSPNGIEWLKAATLAGGVYRLRAGQQIPVFHVIFIKGRKPFVAPAPLLRQGHRTVSRKELLRGGPLIEGEMIVEPIIRVEFVQDSVFIKALLQGRTKIEDGEIQSPSLVFTCPARILLAPAEQPQRSFILYQHIFGSGSSYPDDGFFYVGITTRSWQKRWAEHRRAIDSGSPLLFHRKFREELEAGRITYVHHRVMSVTTDIEALYAGEEFLVDGHWRDARRLNMIPGGKSGLRHMREKGISPKRLASIPGDRVKIISNSLKYHPRKGLPAPWLTEKWRNNDWAVAQICGREDRLSIDQVRAIRELAKNYSPAEIATKIGAKNDTQIIKVIKGKTYSRVGNLPPPEADKIE